MLEDGPRLLSDPAEPVRLAAIKAEVEIANDPRGAADPPDRFEAEPDEARPAEVAKAFGQARRQGCPAACSSRPSATRRRPAP